MPNHYAGKTMVSFTWQLATLYLPRQTLVLTVEHTGCKLQMTYQTENGC